MRGQNILTARCGWARFAAAVALAALLAACGPLRENIAPTAPAMSGQWASLLDEIRRFERGIGFDATGNFADVANDLSAFPFCGHAPALVLPWSYEDPAIRWSNAESAEDCRARAPNDDIYFRKLEAQGESSTPVTGAMLAGKLDRFVYLVLHEDCHDQFELPYGVEESLCDFVTHQAMSAFAEQNYSPLSRERRSIRRYAETQAELAQATVEWYAQVEALYARHGRGEITADALLIERTVLFSAAEQPLGFARGELNNVSLATNMTYSRYYTQIGAAFEANGRDLARSVTFFKMIDAGRRNGGAAQQQRRIGEARSAGFLREQEGAIINAIGSAARGAGNPR